MYEHGDHQRRQAIILAAQELAVTKVDANDQACAAMQWDREEQPSEGGPEAEHERVLHVFRCGEAGASSQAIDDQSSAIDHAVLEQDSPHSHILEQLFQEGSAEVGLNEGVQNGVGADHKVHSSASRDRFIASRSRVRGEVGVCRGQIRPRGDVHLVVAQSNGGDLDAPHDVGTDGQANASIAAAAVAPQGAVMLMVRARHVEDLEYGLVPCLR
mmetsp:Transcript_69079/g.174140  ORF Transcript_69079/g.174140 Transcript_69079/m.174140 type:complete len:214 (+) Transcript_69079:953-1594(+)